MENKEMKTYTLSQLKDKYIGKIGTAKRDKYEHELEVKLIRINTTKKNTR